MGLVSYLLIGFWYDRPTAIYANLKAFLVNRVGDFGFTARLNLLNAFNYPNYSSFNLVSVGSGGTLDPVVEVNKYGDTYYVPRTITFEVGFNY